MPALHSCAQSQNWIPASGNRSEIGIIAEPMMPKACSIPCICNTLMKASSVVIFIVSSPGILDQSQFSRRTPHRAALVRLSFAALVYPPRKVGHFDTHRQPGLGPDLGNE